MELMKFCLSALSAMCLMAPVYASDTRLEGYVASFDYAARQDMKIDSKELIALMKKDKAQLVDIRFIEEHNAWKVVPSINIPINELPNKLSSMDKTKTIVTACPHKDRAIIAMVYLRSKGFKAKYLTDGLIGFAENLRGDDAKSFIDARSKLEP